jgi:hypothetical protein
MPKGVAKQDLPSKPCAACGRSFSWRKRWARNWEEVRYCSDACRRARAGDGDAGERLETAILEQLSTRPAGATLCPSEVARACFPNDAWRTGMESVRRAARRLVRAGRLEITQGGKVVDPDGVRGAIRLRLPKR